MQGVKSLSLTMKTYAKFIVYSYRIIYRLRDDEALVVAVIHGRRILQ